MLHARDDEDLVVVEPVALEAAQVVVAAEGGLQVEGNEKLPSSSDVTSARTRTAHDVVAC